jgi:hypothetical protein
VQLFLCVIVWDTQGHTHTHTYRHTGTDTQTHKYMRTKSARRKQGVATRPVVGKYELWTILGAGRGRDELPANNSVGNMV